MDLARFRLQPCDVDFYAQAPLRYVGTFDAPRAADAVWAELTRDGTLDWCRALSPVQWTSGRPFGVGTTRRLRALGALVLDEQYFEWIDGERKSFYVARASLPLFRRFAECYVVEPLGPDRSRFTWTATRRRPPPSTIRPRPCRR
jgi:hypothetical protein